VRGSAGVFGGVVGGFAEEVGSIVFLVDAMTSESPSVTGKEDFGEWFNGRDTRRVYSSDKLQKMPKDEDIRELREGTIQTSEEI
jgi:hypothetical protein